VKCELNALGAKALATGIQNHPTLIILNIAAANIPSEGAKAIADMLKYNNTLEELSICNPLLNIIASNNIKDEGAIEIGSALKYNKTLTKLDLCNLH